MSATVINNSKLMAHMLAVRYVDIIEQDGTEKAVAWATAHVTPAIWERFCEYAESELTARGFEVSTPL